MDTEPQAAANQSIYESCTTDFIKLDAEGCVISISQPLCQLINSTVEQVVGSHARESGTHLDTLLNSNELATINADNGSQYRFNHTSLPDISDNSCLHIFTNISTIHDLYSENQRLKEEARQLQLIDPDTSLLTQRALLLVLESQVARSRRYNTPLSVLILKLNTESSTHTHKINMLKLSRILKDQLRWSDMIARSNESSFTIVLPETDQNAAQNLVEKLQSVLNLTNTNLAVLSGIATWDRNISSVELLDHCLRQLSNMHGDTDHYAAG